MAGGVFGYTYDIYFIISLWSEPFYIGVDLEGFFSQQQINSAKGNHSGRTHRCGRNLSTDATYGSLPRYLARIFILPERNKSGMTKVISRRPFCIFDCCDELWLEPDTFFHVDRS
jgi:hypothetical protein